MLSSSPVPPSESKVDEVERDERIEGETEREVLIYEGPFEKTVRRIKVFSLSSCFLTLVGSPLLVYFGNADIPLLHRSALGVAVMGFGLATTFLLNFIVKPYVIRMTYLPDREPKQLRLETLNFFGRKKVLDADIESLSTQTSRPLSTFAHPPSNMEFFLHEDVIVQNQNLKPLLKHVIYFPTAEEMEATRKEREEMMNGGAPKKDE